VVKCESEKINNRGRKKTGNGEGVNEGNARKEKVE